MPIEVPERVDPLKFRQSVFDEGGSAAVIEQIKTWEVGRPCGPFGEQLPDECLERANGGWGHYDPKFDPCRYCTASAECAVLRLKIELSPQSVYPRALRRDLANLRFPPNISEEQRLAWVHVCRAYVKRKRNAVTLDVPTWLKTCRSGREASAGLLGTCKSIPGITLLDGQITIDPIKVRNWMKG